MHATPVIGVLLGAGLLVGCELHLSPPPKFTTASKDQALNFCRARHAILDATDLPRLGRQLWSNALGAAPCTAMIVMPRHVLVLREAGLTAVDRTSGALAWSLDEPLATISRPAVWRDAYLWTAPQRGTVAVDVATGRIRWRLPVSGLLQSLEEPAGLAVIEADTTRRVVVDTSGAVTSDRKLEPSWQIGPCLGGGLAARRAIGGESMVLEDVVTGRERARFEGLGEWPEVGSYYKGLSSGLGDGGTIVLVAPGHDGRGDSLVGVAAASATERWRLPCGLLAPRGPAVDGDALYFGSMAGEGADRTAFLTCIGRATGAVRWRFAMRGLRLLFKGTWVGHLTDRPVLTSTAVFFGAGDCRIYAVERATGDLRWTTEAVQRCSAVALGAVGGRLFAREELGDDVDLVRVLDESTGQELSSLALGGEFAHCGLALSDDAVYLLESSGQLHALAP